MTAYAENDELSGFLDWLTGKSNKPGPEHTTMLVQFPVLLRSHQERLVGLRTLVDRYAQAKLPQPTGLVEIGNRITESETRLNTMIGMIRKATAEALRKGELRQDQLPQNSGLEALLTTGVIITIVIAVAIAAILLPLGFFDLYQTHQREDNITAQMLATAKAQADVQIAAAQAGKPVPAFPPQTFPGPTSFGPGMPSQWGSIGLMALAGIALLVFSPLIKRSAS